MNNQYMNPNTNQSMNSKPASHKWDDKCMMEDLLGTTKHIVEQYGTNVIEGSTQQLRQILNQNMDQTINDQYQIFEQLNQRGWYPTKAAQQPDVQAAKQMFSQTRSQLM